MTRTSDERLMMMVFSRSEEPGARFRGESRQWADDEFGTDTTERDDTKTREVRIARSRSGRWAASSGVRRDARFVGSEICASAIDARAFRDASSPSTRTEVVAHVARPSHAENGQVPAQVARVAQLAASQARLEHLAVHTRTRSRGESASTSRRRPARVRPSAWEAREALPTSASRHSFSSDYFRASGNDRERTPRNVEPYIFCMGKHCESCTARFFEKTRRRSFAGKKSACTSASHQGTRSAARGFRPAAPGSAPFVPTRVPFASPAGRVTSAPRAFGASVGRRRPNAHRAHRRRRRPDAARRR